MIELYLSKRDPQSQTEEEGKLYARVSYKESMNVQDVATHMASHNTIYSEGTIVGVMTDFVRCVRHLILEGKTVKIDNLAIFKATVEANGLTVLYDADTDKGASATLGTLAAGAKTGAAVKVVKLLAQATGEVTRDELKKSVKLTWTDKTKAEIAAAKGTTSPETSDGGGSSTTGGSTTGGSTTGGGGSTGGNTGGGTTTGDNTGGSGNTGGNGDDYHDPDGGTNSDE